MTNKQKIKNLEKQLKDLQKKYYDYTTIYIYTDLLTSKTELFIYEEDILLWLQKLYGQNIYQENCNFYLAEKKDLRRIDDITEVVEHITIEKIGEMTWKIPYDEYNTK